MEGLSYQSRGICAIETEDCDGGLAVLGDSSSVVAHGGPGSSPLRSCSSDCAESRSGEHGDVDGVAV